MEFFYDPPSKKPFTDLIKNGVLTFSWRNQPQMEKMTLEIKSIKD
jgi:hypothetical protein